MLSPRFALTMAAAVFLGGCATRQEVLLTKASGAKPIATVVHMAEDGNSQAMDAHLRSAFEKEGVQVKAKTPAGAQKTKEADAVVSYIDVWRWDIAMYLRSLTVRIYDGETGDLLVIGNWADSPLHGFRDPKLAFEGVVKDMLARLKAAAKDK